MVASLLGGRHPLSLVSRPQSASPATGSKAAHDIEQRMLLDEAGRSAFESVDRPAMKALPASPYEVAQWKNARVNIDYHVMYDDRPYRVPHTMVGAEVQVPATVTTVEILHKARRVVAYPRCWGPKGTATPLKLEDTGRRRTATTGRDLRPAWCLGPRRSAPPWRRW
jgi:hypothetical protein